MNTDKLLKAIQILIREELKQQLPTLIKEGVNHEINKILKESNNVVTRKNNTNISANSNKNIESVMYSKNSIINDILNETKNSNNRPSDDNRFDEWPTMPNNISNVIATPNINDVKIKLSQKMGYGDMIDGMGANTGIDAIDKALNRDYRELVRRFKK